MMADVAAGVAAHGATRSADPFDPDNDRALPCMARGEARAFSGRLAALIVEVGDPRALTVAERAAMLARCRDGQHGRLCERARAHADKEIPRRLGAQFGLASLDRNWLADDDGVSRVTVTGEAGRGEYIPYTNRPIRWHTDGYYNPPERRIRAMVLHCVAAAAEGGVNALLDHEIAYLLLRDARSRDTCVR